MKISNKQFSKILEYYNASNFKIDTDGNAHFSVVPKRGKLGDLKSGTVFKVGKYEFIKLGDGKDTTAALCKNSIKEMKFGNCNDYSKSDIRKFINGDFRKEIEDEIGAKNLFSHTVDLLSLNGRKTYKCEKDKVSLITLDNYRRYRSVIPEFGNWWWTATPWSTTEDSYSSGVCYVDGGGCVGSCDYDFCWGVRPFCIFSSSIFVSLNKKIDDILKEIE